MKRRAEFLVRKRDGRKESLRATKLGRSIRLAAEAATAGDAIIEEWWSMELTAAVLAGMRQKRGKGVVLTTRCLGEAVEQVFLATGFPHAADAYRQAGAEQRRRRALLRSRRLADVAVAAESHREVGPRDPDPIPRV